MSAPPTRRAALLAGVAALSAAGRPALAQAAPDRGQVLAAMRRATRFMTDKVAYRGGYVWSYLPDFSRRWGELEARPTMVWVQPPGTATMGHLYLDAFHATGEAQFYEAAEQVAGALIHGQHPSGGWNYLIDFGGEASIRDWYETYGRNAWRMEEFHHDLGNATFDDAGTSEAMQFLLRLYLEKRDAKYRPAVDKAIRYVLESQHPVGGWPQRWPHADHGPAYTRFITFNDDVAGENLKFLIMVYQTLGDRRVLDPIQRAMTCFLVTQQGQPQPAWGLQHTLDLKPAAARTYEPLAFATHTTANNLDQLMNFYQLTGERKFLARVGEGLDWLDKVKLQTPRPDGRTHPTFIEIGTDRPLYVHRTGSNVVNGRYFADYRDQKLLGHYGAYRRINVAKMRARLAKLLAMSPEKAAKDLPLLSTRPITLPRFFANQDISTSDLNAVRAPPVEDKGAAAARILAELNAEGWWPSKLAALSNPYRGPGPKTPTPGDYASTHVGDAWDTSPYPVKDGPVGISIAHYIGAMSTLIAYLEQTKAS
ncbi:pectate lyase [Phenylobacterium sp. J367]|uniref:pectate lyase n=1 Tax=Phenylobacterium sp. J367 TaxID=2898435 RepID=UPI002150B119|nr:pectate lyase [Phenylobacterium sp. J367]MCR5880919.1 pectate lyase [Phenylobacterium sp. J367]